MQVVYSLVGKLAASLLVLLDMRKPVLLQLPYQYFRLLVEVILLQFLHKRLDL